MEKEYRGQKVMDTFGARLIPPNDRYPDCKCLLVLTAQHLYVLEDNYDGTYETHFEFVLREIDDIRIEQEESDHYSENKAVSAASLIITEVVCALAGLIAVPGGNQKRNIKKKFFVISYHDMQGEKGNIYFNMDHAGAKDFIRMFHKLKEV